MTTPLVTVRRDGAIAHLTLTRADRRNALSTDMMRALIEAAQQFDSDEATRVVIVDAEGGDFSIGADLTQRRFQGGEQPSLLARRRSAELGAKLMRAIQGIPQPTVCALQGVATGGGACIATACDFRIGATNARIGYGEVKMGMNLMWTALPACVHLVGPARAKRLIMTGKLFDAETMERWGFLDEVVAPEDLAAAARRWADEFAVLPPVAVQMIKRSIAMVAGPMDQAIMHMDTDQWVLASGSADFREAVSAFFEKRKPEFKGD